MRRLCQEFEHYCIIGGMPAAVKADIMRNSSIGQEEIRQMLLNSYIADMTKYADKGIQYVFLKHMILCQHSLQKIQKNSNISL